MEIPQKTPGLTDSRVASAIQFNASYLAAEFTDIVYNMALIRGLEVNWLDYQMKLWRAMTKRLRRASGRTKNKLHEGPATVGRKRRTAEIPSSRCCRKFWNG